MNKSRQPSMGTFMGNLKSDPLKTFQIIEKLGEGTYAVVYKALNKITDKLVAIKVFPAHNDQYAYLNEIEFLRKIDHPYMVKLYEVYTTGDEIWMILDYCQLGSIQDLMNMTGQQLSEPEIACVCYSVLQALDYIHTLNKIHRDVKAANILINSFGQVKLTDFGICSKEASSNSFIGSLLWMAPEMISCDNYDTSVDIWALGIAIIEMAEGNAPYHHLHMIRAKYAIQKKPQTSFNDPLRFSDELNDFLESCLQLRPENRPKALHLLRHPFMEKYKRDMPSIRRSFCQDRMQKVEEYRKDMLLNKKQSGPALLEEMNYLRNEYENNGHGNEHEHEHPMEYGVKHLNISEIECKDASQGNLTFIEKSSLNIMNGGQYSYRGHLTDSHRSNYSAEVKGQPHSQLQYAIKHIRSENEGEPTFPAPAVDVRIEHEQHQDQQIEQHPQQQQQAQHHLQQPNVLLRRNFEEVPISEEDESSYISSPFRSASHTRDVSAIKLEQKNLKVPQLNLKTYIAPNPDQKKLQVYNDPSRYQTREDKDKATEYSSAIRSEQNSRLPTKMYDDKPQKLKMYKMTNDSNFVVKHQGYSSTAMRTQLNQSVDTDSTLNPVSVDRRKQQELEEFSHEGEHSGLVTQMMMDIHKLTKTRESVVRKDRTPSTATGSKVGSNGEISFYKTPGHTPNPSGNGKHRLPVGMANGYNTIMETPEGGSFFSQNKSERLKTLVDEEKSRLEEQMERELEQVKSKYQKMLLSLDSEAH